MQLQLSDLTLAELEQGYIFNAEQQMYRCIFCDEQFEEGVIYHSKGRMVSARRAVMDHIDLEHKGVFNSLMSLDKQLNGLTDVQKKLLACLYAGKGNRTISEEMDISIATVRSHRFNLQKAKKEAMILLTLLQKIETLPDQVPHYDAVDDQDVGKEEGMSNTLHPFFKRYI